MAERKVPEVGKKAPAFTLPDASGKKVSLKDHLGKKVILYFYPRDDTPGCTLEAQGFNKVLGQLDKLGAAVIGVSKDDLPSHCKFRDKYGLKFPLLSDPDGKVIEKYGAWGEKNMYGRTSMGIVRTTVIIGKDGRVAKVFPKVRVKGHVDKVLAVVRELATTS